MAQLPLLLTEVKLVRFNIAKIIAPCYDQLFTAAVEHRYTHFWTKGGRGSLKSSTIGILLPILQIMHPDCHVVVLRKVANTLKNSVFNQLLWALEMLGIYERFRITYSPLEITYLATGQKILFFGVDDKAKIKSIKLPFGYIGVVWYEELDQFAGMEEIRSLNQSLLRGGPEYWCFYSYNPPKSRDNWVNQEVLVEEKDKLVTSTNYLQAPKNWLGEQFFLEAEKLKNKREELWRHEYMGEAIGTGGDIFSNVENMRMSGDMVSRFDKLYYGLDFGFAVDPLAFVCMYYDKKREDLYIFDEIYKYSYDTKPAAAEVKEKAGRRLIIADSAEPRTIRAFHNLGCNIRGAKKGPDSVEHGIKFLQSLNHIYIDKARCPNAYKEFVGYEYAQDKNGNFISQYPDKNNHCLTGDTLVSTTQGEKPIKDLVGTKGNVYCYDEQLQSLAVKPYYACRKTQENAQVFEVELEDGRCVKATASHPVYTQRGWVCIGDLKESDCVLVLNNHD